jgi:hypothetical protein
MSKPIVCTETRSQSLSRSTAAALRNLLGELRRAAIQAKSPRNQPTDTACSPSHTDAPTPGAAS